jgi:undecaprenyl-diphosphatase
MVHVTQRSRSMPPAHARRARRHSLLAFLTALALLAGGAFALLAYGVVNHLLVEPNTQFELGVHALATPTLDTFFSLLTRLGSVAVIGLLTAVIGLSMFVRGRREDAVFLGATMLGAVGLTEGLKHAFHQVRPALFHPMVQEHGFSFPSGHATLSFALFGFLALWLLMEAPGRLVNWAAAAACVALAAAIALSRIYLGVHWPSDVLAGMLVATTWVAAVSAVRQALLPPLEE